MLELLNKDENDEINERYNTLCDDIGAKLKKEETSEIRGLEASSKRFALIVLSYQILREALIFKIQEGDCGFKAVLNDDKEDDYSSIIIDKTEDIEKILIDNLVAKMKLVNLVQKPKDNNALLKYIYNNKDYFKEINQLKGSKEAREVIEGKIIGVYVRDNKNNNIRLYTSHKNQLDMFWYMESIPNPSIIMEFIGEVEDSGGDTKKAIELGKKYNALTINAQRDKNRTNEIELAKALGKNNVYFSYIDISLYNMKDTEEKAESTKSKATKTESKATKTESKATKTEKESDKQ